MNARISRWIDEMVRRGVVKSREDVLNGVIVTGCILTAAGIALLALACGR